jgi:hypothetical protein
MTTQQISSLGRQVLAILGIVFGVLTQSVGSLHLPVAISSILTIGGAVILAVEHYLSDPSTGTPTYMQNPPVAQPGPQPVPARQVPPSA